MERASEAAAAPDAERPSLPGGAGRLYGRTQELAQLLAAFEHACHGEGSVVLVSGASGGGKTSLVEGIAAAVEARNGLFLQGKFAQYQREVPLSSLRQALTGLARRLLDEPPARQLEWCASIREAVGELGQLLLELVPALAPLLGSFPAVGEIAPLEARHRLGGVLRAFLHVVCRPEHPVVLFLDDWQWADPASLHLLGQLELGTGLRWLLLVASWRDHEVDEGHPLHEALEALRQQGVTLRRLQVQPLQQAEVTELLLDTLRPACREVEALAAVLTRRTGGNPFFLRSLLELLVEDGLLERRPGGDAWTWRLGEAGEAGLPEELVGLFGRRLGRLSEEARLLLSRAACLGDRFTLGALAALTGRSVAHCRGVLRPLTNERLRLLRLDAPPTGADGADERLAFAHDRVQQAAFQLIPAAALPAVRLELGRRLLAGLDGPQLEELLFVVADHLGAAVDLVTEPAEQRALVALDVRAARRAHRATAYGAALHFHRAAAGVLALPGVAARLWREEPALLHELTLAWAESEFLEGDRARAEALVHEAVEHARSAIERAEALDVLIRQFTLLARYPAAIAAGREALQALGISLPDDAYEAARDAEIAEVRAALAGGTAEAWFHRPVMTDPAMRAAAKVLISLGPPCYRAHQRLWAVIVPKVVNLTFRFGHIPQIGYSHPAFGGLLAWVSGDHALGASFGLLATRLMAQTFPQPSDQSVFRLMIGSSLRHWSSHLRRSSEDYAEAWESGVRSGNLQYAAYAFGHDFYCRFYQGLPLEPLAQSTQRALTFSRSRVNQWAIDLLEGGLRVVEALGAAEPGLPGLERDAPAWLERVSAHQNVQVTCIYRVLEAFARMLVGDHEGALRASDEAAPLVYTVGTQGLLPWPEHRFARHLILTALWSSSSAARRDAFRPELDAIEAQLATWARTSPENFEHKRLLAVAERARIEGRVVAAMHGYEAAIAAARLGGFLQWEGIANERASWLWAALGDEALAQIHWQQAYACFDRWGARAKVAAMEARYRQRLLERLPAPVDAAEGLELARLVDGHVERARRSASAQASEQKRSVLAEQADELVVATSRLRAEVAERKHAEEELRRHRERLEATVRERTAALQRKSAHYELLLRTSSDALHVVDLDGRLLEWNDAFRAHLGYDDARLAGMTIDEFDVDRGPAGLRDELGRLLREGGRFEARHRRADGVVRDVEIIVAGMRVEERDVLLASARDITERRRREAELEELHQAARRDAATKAELLREINHRVKNNLTSILGLLAGERAHAPNACGPALDAALDRLAERIGGLLELHGLLAESGWAPVRIAELAELILRGAGAASPVQARLELTIEPTELRVSPRQASSLALVLNELATNSRKHASPGRDVLRIGLRAREEGDFLALEYRDDGPGYPAEVLERGATGVGLALLRDLVTESLRGSVQLSTEGGARTILRIRTEEAGRT